jgi:hypothetical protein
MNKTRNPLQDLGNRIGLYAYLAAVGGLRYWPVVREVAIEERTLSITPAPPRHPLEDAVEHEREKKATAA